MVAKSVGNWVGPMAAQTVVMWVAMWVDRKDSARVEQRGLNWAEKMVALKAARWGLKKVVGKVDRLVADWADWRENCLVDMKANWKADLLV